MSTQGDLFEARAARDVALSKVTKNAGGWMDRALAEIKDTGWLFGPVTGEDLRRLVDAKVGKPHHSNAYGALIRTAVKRGILRDTGRVTQMRLKNSHARRTPVYEVMR